MGCSSTNNKDDTGNNKTRYEHNNAITSEVENGCAIEGEEGVGHSNTNNTNNNNNNGNNNGKVYNHINNNARSNSKKVIINKLSPSLVLTNIHNKDVFFFTQLHYLKVPPFLAHINIKSSTVSSIDCKCTT